MYSTIVLPPVVEMQPTSIGVGGGRSATFTVVASGEGLSYQWFGPGGVALSDTLGEIVGATTATLQIFNVQSDDLGNYQVRISNIGGSVDSNLVTLSFSKFKKIYTIIHLSFDIDYLSSSTTRYCNAAK